jgi:sirohydrochlorin cobaltochelatase
MDEHDDGPVLPGVILLAHGSPDPDWRRPIEQIRDRMAELDAMRDIVAAYMGFIPPTLDEAIAALHARGHRHLIVLAAFLSPGGNHIKKDIPALVEAARAAFPDVTLELRPGAVGAAPEVVEAFARVGLLQVLDPSAC